MKAVFALSTLVFAASIFAQDSVSLSATDSVASASDAPLSTSNSPSFTASDSATPTSVSLASESAATGSASASLSASASSKPSSSLPAGALIATGTSSANPIPTGISGNCSAFLDVIDTDKQFASCTAPLLNATAAFAPTANSTKQSTAALVSTLDKLCATPGCSDTYIRSLLAKFYSACKPELTGSKANADIKATYDILYIMKPFMDSICSKDSGTYCVLQTPSKSSVATTTNNSTSGVQNLAISSGGGTDAEQLADAVAKFNDKGIIKSGSPVERRAASTSDQTIIQYAPDTQVYHDSGVMYLYALPGLSAEALCTNCTQSMLAAYAAWETDTLYGPGLASSTMLGDQAKLWTSTQQKCGTEFVQAIQKAAGSKAAADSTNAATATNSVGLGSGFAAVFAVAIGAWVAL